MQRKVLRGRAGVRAWKYEKKLKEGKGRELAKECWKETKEGAQKGRYLKRWEEERKEYIESLGWSLEKMEGLRETEELRGEIIIEKEKEKQRKNRCKLITKSKYNRW